LDGPETEAQWDECRKSLGEAGCTYLERHKECFELYGNDTSPGFMQVPNLEKSPNATLDKLDFGLAAGSNVTLFDHGASPDGREHSPGWCALMLLTSQCFSPGGTIGTTRWRGRWTTQTGKKPKGPGTSEHAPALEGGALHVIVRRENLLDTIHQNLLTKELVARIPRGRPVWERMPEGADDAGCQEIVSSYLGRLVPLSRAIKLEPGSRSFTLVDGLSYPKLPESREPWAPVQRRKNNDFAYTRIDLSRHPWRELGSVLMYSSSMKEGGPLTLIHLRERAENTEEIDLWTGGLSVDKAKVRDYGEWVFRLPVSLMGSTEIAKYQDGVELAMKGEWSLKKQGVYTYWKDLMVDKPSDLESKAASIYWAELDRNYRVLIDAANNPQKSIYDDWRKTIYRSMHYAYNLSCPHDTPRQIRAFARGQRSMRLPGKKSG